MVVIRLGRYTIGTKVEKELVAICDPGDGNDWIDIIWNGYRAMIMAVVLM